MARIRSIKPETWSDEKFVELSPLARLLFVALWNYADDEGRLEYAPRQIKLRCLPADSCDVSELIGEIRREKMLTVYEVENKQYIQICNFTKHQKVDHRRPSKLPPAPNCAERSEKKALDQGRDQGKDQGSNPKPFTPFVEDSPNGQRASEDFENDSGAAKISGRRCDGTNPRALGTNPKAMGTNPRALGTNPRATGTNPRSLRTNPKAVAEDREAQQRRNMAFSAIFESHSHLGPARINAILDARERGETHPDDPKAAKPPDPQPDRVAAVVAGAAKALGKTP